MTADIPPIPRRNEKRELVDISVDISVDIVQLTAALDQTLAVLGHARSRPLEMSVHAPSAALRASWAESLAEVQASLDKTDELARTLILSIRRILALE